MSLNFLKRNTFFIVLVLLTFSQSAFSQKFDHYETIIEVGDSCLYLIPDASTSGDWMQAEFDDSLWIKAVSGIGYGDGDDNTIIDEGVISLYMRFHFNIVNNEDIHKLLLDADYDDGFVAYLNGHEIGRRNVPTDAAWNTPASDLHEATLFFGGTPERFEIDFNPLSSIINDGENVLAVAVHNEKKSSSDMSGNFFLHAAIISDTYNYKETPEWFSGPVFYDEFNLPLMVINTYGKTIPDEPRILAGMKLIDNENELNHAGDFPNNYNGQINIERRGESSSGFAKKSYSIELQDSDGSPNNTSLLGLPKENDFVLYGPFSDKTLMRNAITYQLYREMGHWAPRTRYFEMILNDEYNGIYVLTEKIKRDKNRVDIDKLTEKDTDAWDISGGYILRRDKTNGMSPEEYWESSVPQVYFERLTYQYYYPEVQDLTMDQRIYIKNWMESFDKVMSGENFKDAQTGYNQFIDISSFQDMTILNEVTKGIDSYMFSTYFYKENDTDGGKLNAGPPWDYNLSMGNMDYGQHHRYTHGWVYDNWSRVYWFKRLLEHVTYKNEVYGRWDELRENVLSEEHIFSIIDSTVNLLGDAIDRNFSRFPVLGIYVWPNQWYPDTYEEEIFLLKEWIGGRLKWMDDEWSNKYSPIFDRTSSGLSVRNKEILIYPTISDFSGLFFKTQGPDLYSDLKLEVLNSMGQVVYALDVDKRIVESRGGMIDDLSFLKSGIYIFKLRESSRLIHIQKLVKEQ